MIDGRPGPDLPPAGVAVPAGGISPLPVAVGSSLLRAPLPPPDLLAPGRVVLRDVVAPAAPRPPPGCG